MGRTNNKTLFWLAAILLCAIGLRLAFFSGVGGSDDVLYASYSHYLSKGNFSFPATHHGTRIGFLYPTSVFYSIFGVNDFSSVLLEFAASIAGIILIFYFGKEFFNEKVGLIAAFLLSIFPLDVIFATKLLPDLPSAFFLSLGVFLFLKAEKNNKQNNVDYLFSGVSVGIAYMIRESALLILLFFLVYVLFYKKFKSSYFLVFSGFAIIFLLESYLFFIKTGDFLFRFHSLTSYYPIVAEADEFFGRTSFPLSLLYFPYIMFTDIQFGSFFTFIFIAIFYNLMTRNKASYPFIMWFFALLIYLSFGSVSLSQYLPFAAIPRYLFVITFPSVILLASFLTEKSTLTSKVLLPGILFFLLISSIGFIYLDKASRNSIDSERKIIKHVNSLDKPVYTDYRTKMVLEYLSAFSNSNIKQFMHVENGKTMNDIDLASARDSYIFVDHRVIKNLLKPHPFIEFSKEIDNPPKNWVVVKEIKNTEGNAILYYAP